MTDKESINEFIKKHWDLLEQKNFDELYKLADDYFRHYIYRIEHLTHTLRLAGIDPLEYFTNKVPDWFMSGSSYVGKIIIPEGVCEIGSSAFQDSNISSVKFPKSLGYIGVFAFRNMSNIKEIYLQNGVGLIGTGAFSDCRGLQKVSMESLPFFVGDNIFRNCFDLKELNLPKQAINNIDTVHKLILPGWPTLSTDSSSMTSVASSNTGDILNINYIY